MEPLTPIMTPAPGDHCCRFVGDTVRFELRDVSGRSPSQGQGWRALLRTNLGRAQQLRREILQAHTSSLPVAGASWRDVPMNQSGDAWTLELPLTEPGFFKAKAYLVDSRGWQHWAHGPDFGISVHPDCYRSGNIIYCAFTRMFGATRTAEAAAKHLPPSLKVLDDQDYTVIPPSGKLRDLTRELPHIFDKLGCRILQLLPVNPTPTTYARFGRYGSPYAALDLTAIDPALVVFDKTTTGVDQFRELSYGVHLRGGRLFLDMVINHTGWGSVLQENHPEWFVRQPDGTFVSPGAWGVTWEDLVELKHQNIALWDELAEVFLTWCKRGVDGFRCDAGYKVPVAAWQYIVASVQQIYPNTIFLLEGLGGAWEATEALLTEGGMQWAYSELFQNYSGKDVATYLDHCIRQTDRVGLLVHFSETHDNDRLAARGRQWSLLRNRLCGLTSPSGGFAFTCGVEWLATEKIKVHGSSGMAWGSRNNIVEEIARLNNLLSNHPCFFDGAKLTRLSAEDSPVYVLLRESEDSKDRVLVLANTDSEKARAVKPRADQEAEVKEALQDLTGQLGTWVDLLGQKAPALGGSKDLESCTLAPGAVYCLAPSTVPFGLGGSDYREARARAAWGLAAIGQVVPAERLGRLDWKRISDMVDRSPADFLGAVATLEANAQDGDTGPGESRPRQDPDWLTTIGESKPEAGYRQVVTWTRIDRNRVTSVPPGHWLLVQDDVPFRAALVIAGEEHEQSAKPTVRHEESIRAGGSHIVCFPPRQVALASSGVDSRVLSTVKESAAKLLLERYGKSASHIEAAVLYLESGAVLNEPPKPRPTDIVLLTNGRGAMARICVDLGRVLSKYDCVLAANLHPSLPVDRHVFVKRIRTWVNADGFISLLDYAGLKSFRPGPPAVWDFVANAGDGRTVEIQISAEMEPGRNTMRFRFSRPTAAQATGKQLPKDADVRLTVRLDIEDRNFHWETHRNAGAEHHFGSHTQTIGASPERRVQMAADPQGAPAEAFVGFSFKPAPERQLQAIADTGCYHPQPEWSENIPHPVEQSRGQAGAGDGYSPGWFELPLPKGADVHLTITAEPEQGHNPASAQDQIQPSFCPPNNAPAQPVPSSSSDPFAAKLLNAIRAFVVQRDTGKTIIAGYPWFLDWGRDTFICARGLIAAGKLEEVRQIVMTFARFEREGTLPNTIFGNDASNRDTSDAPLWFGVVCEELAAALGSNGDNASPVDIDKMSAENLDEHLRGMAGNRREASPTSHPFYASAVDDSTSRSLMDVLGSIAHHYVQGTPNGIRMDPESALIWSPSHFTWMDTNYPAGTPREGYPIEIQALWVRLLRQLGRLSGSAQKPHWETLAAKAQASIEKFFWLEEAGYYADVLPAVKGQPASAAEVDDALRSNCLFLVSLGLAEGERAQRCVEAARRHLVVPGGLRSLAPLPVKRPLRIYAVGSGQLLNDPRNPYWGRYEGDEDTRRKPAYHNGTAWTWTFPVFCEALGRAWNFSAVSVAAAKAYLGSMGGLMSEGCLGHIPEVLDGDAPHTARGCDAQAWSVTEALRVWRLLRK